MSLPTPKPTREDGDDFARADALSILPGEVLGGKYRIDARLAEGGMGVVLRATHLDLDCPVAIKLLRPEHATNEDVIGRLLAEARIAAGLRSKHVNHVLDVGRAQDGLPYLVLEYMEGSDLGGHLELHGKLPPREAVDYVLQACEGLAEAHAVGIVHRDLKPENLFLAEDADGGFVLKILDFGISKAPPTRRGGRTLTNPFEVVGSPTYMSPEQIRGAVVDARTDIWALGVVLHELCTCQLFFEAESVTETFKRILNERDVPGPFGSGADAERLHAIIRRCLRRSPDERYQSVVELAEALGPLASDSLQAGRVAKVAAAARARVVARVDPNAPSNLPTPLALSTSNVERALAEGKHPFAPRPRFQKWLLAAAAVVAAGFGLRHALPRPPAALASSASSARPLPMAATLAPVLREPGSPSSRMAEPRRVPAVTSVATAMPRPRPPAPVRLPPSRSVTVALAPPLAKVDAPTAVANDSPRALDSADPAPALELATATAAPAAPEAEPGLDAWDPKTFGGRR
jgi:eukaryotic-like serine/threonine-protein kinase